MNMDPGTWSARVAGAIRAEMAAQLRSASALADHLGVARPDLVHRLGGHRPFDLVEVEVVAAWLGVPPPSCSPARRTPTPSAPARRPPSTQEGTTKEEECHEPPSPHRPLAGGDRDRRRGAWCSRCSVSASRPPRPRAPPRRLPPPTPPRPTGRPWTTAGARRATNESPDGAPPVPSSSPKEDVASCNAASTSTGPSRPTSSPGASGSSRRPCAPRAWGSAASWRACSRDRGAVPPRPGRRLPDQQAEATGAVVPHPAGRGMRSVMAVESPVRRMILVLGVLLVVGVAASIWRGDSPATTLGLSLVGTRLRRVRLRLLPLGAPVAQRSP